MSNPLFQNILPEDIPIMLKRLHAYCSRSKFLTKLLKTFDKTFREIFPVFISTKRREKTSAFLTIIL